MNVANQTFWIEVVEVGRSHDTARISFCGGEQEGTRLPPRLLQPSSWIISCHRPRSISMRRPQSHT